MSRTRRNFSPAFKSVIVLEILKGERDWKMEFIEKASKADVDAKEYIKTLSSDELEKVTNIDILNKAIAEIDEELKKKGIDLDHQDYSDGLDQVVEEYTIEEFDRVMDINLKE